MVFIINKLKLFHLFGIWPTISKTIRFTQKRNCYSIFGIKDLVQHEKTETFSVMPIESFHHEMAVRLAKRYFLAEHVFVRTRNMDLNNDRSIDEYIIGLLKQGNSLFAKTEDDKIAGFCINFAASPIDPSSPRNFAFYRQDPNTKDFLYYTAKLQETPNLWNIFKEDKVFEVGHFVIHYQIKMLAVLPEYRRQGLATMLTQKSKNQAKDQGYKIIRMDCINHYDYKIAERCMLSCLVKFPLHKLRGAKASFIKKNSDHNRHVRVYVDAPIAHDAPDSRIIDFESMFQ